MIKPWVDSEIGDPAGSFLHSEREPLESRILVAEGGVDDRQLVRAEPLVAAHPLKIVGNPKCITPLAQSSEGMTETGQHHWTVEEHSTDFVNAVTASPLHPSRSSAHTATKCPSGSRASRFKDVRDSEGVRMTGGDTQAGAGLRSIDRVPV